MANDKAIIFGNEVDLHLSTSGHYCISIIPEFNSSGNDETVLILEANLLKIDKEKQIKKIHYQFGHASKERITKLLTDANIQTNEIKAIIKKSHCFM